jgi:hypothetical protein
MMTRAPLISLTGAATAIALLQYSPAAQSPLPSAFAVSPDLPYDVDVAALRALNRDTQVPEAQRLFDTFAWRVFVALNWPAGPDGKPDRARGLSDNATPRVWMGWRPNETVFKPDGGTPEPWNGDTQIAPTEHFLWRFNKMLDESHSRVNELSEAMQAFTGPLVDQSGAFVRYESYMNEPQFTYVVENQLYNQEGQLAFVATSGRTIQFPANVTGPQPRYGSMSIKLAWKELGDNDIAARFLTRQITVKTRVPRLMGVVGMHVTALTQSSPNWIWATFEHVDNVVSSDLEFGTTLKGERRRVRPNFSNPDTPTKRVNILPAKNAAPDANGVFTNWDEARTTTPTQLTRVIPIPLATQALNNEVQRLLRQTGSVLQYYELEGTQWPVQPGFPAFGGGGNTAPESIVFKAPGRVVPVYLVNTTMESYFQAGDQVAGPLEEDDRLPIGTFSDGARESVTPDRTRVFGTESCVGCHFSAGAVVGFKTDENGNFLKDAAGLRIPIYGKNGSFGQTGNAHYVWQLQLKARQRQTTAPR